MVTTEQPLADPNGIDGTRLEPSILDLAHGDIAFILNGAQSSIFKAEVAVVGTDWIEVLNVDKGEWQKFSLPSGEALADIEFKTGKPLLVHYADWRARFLLARGQFRKLHVYVQERAAEFAKDPTNANGQSVLAASHALVSFASNSDPISLVAGSVQEYRAMRNSGSLEQWREDNWVGAPRRPSGRSS